MPQLALAVAGSYASAYAATAYAAAQAGMTISAFQAAGMTVGASAMAVGSVAGMGVTMIGSRVLGLDDVDSGQSAAGMQVNTQSSAVAIPVIYGRAVKGINRVFVDSYGDKNKYLAVVGVICEGEVDSIQNIYLDQVPISDKQGLHTFTVDYGTPSSLLQHDRNGNSTSHPVDQYRLTISGTKFNGASVSALVAAVQGDTGYSSSGYTIELVSTYKLRVEATALNDSVTASGAEIRRNGEWTEISRTYNDAEAGIATEYTSIEDSEEDNLIDYTFYPGSGSQVADSELTTNLPEQWTSAHRLRGVAYIRLRLEYDQKKMDHIPQVLCDIKGVKVLDTRTSTTAWSDNPAMCIRDYLVNTTYGRGIDPSRIDATSFEDAADYCDETVTHPSKASWDLHQKTDLTTGGQVTKSNGVSSNWNSAAFSDDVMAVTGSATQSFTFRWNMGLFQELRLSSVGISASNSTVNPDTLGFSIRPTARTSDGTYTFQCYEDGSAVGSTFQYSLHSTIIGGLRSQPLDVKIEVVNNTLTYYTKLNTESSWTSRRTTSIANNNYYAAFMGKQFGPSVRLNQTVSRKRYTLNGIVDTDKSMVDNLKGMLTSCRGMLIYSGGKYKLRIDKPESPVMTFDEDNIVGGWRISLPNKTNLFNRVRASYTNIERQSVPDFVIVDDATFRTNNDNGLLLERQIAYPFTNDPHRVKELAIISLNESRQQIRVSFTSTIAGTKCEVGDVIAITHDVPGWTAKEFRITEMTLQNNDEVQINCVEYNAASYSGYVIPEEDFSSDTNLVDPNNSAYHLPPTAITWLAETYDLTQDGLLSWTAPSVPYITGYEVQVNKVVDAYSGRATSRNTYSTHSTSLRLDGLANGFHEVWVRTVFSSGAVSPWTQRRSLLITQPVVPVVSGLRLSDNETSDDGNALQFSGGDVSFEWNHTDNSHFTNEALGIDHSEGKPRYIKHYKMDFYNTSGNKFDTQYTEDNKFTYTLHMNQIANNGTPLREFQIKVYAVNQVGRQSGLPAVLGGTD